MQLQWRISVPTHGCLNFFLDSFPLFLSRVKDFVPARKLLEDATPSDISATTII